MSGKDISIAILGAGNIGCSLAGEWTLEGFDVSLAELPEFKENLEFPIKRGGIEVTGELKTGFAKIDKITTDIPDAIQGRDLIFITSIAFGHEAFTRICAPHLEDGQVLIYGSYFSALRIAKLIKELEVDKDITIAETLSAIYASDRIGKKGEFFPELYRDGAKVQIKRFKEGLPIAAFPAKKTKKILDKVKKVYPTMTASSNVLETSVFNVNPLGHTPGVILNAGWIEYTKGGFSFGSQGNTPAVRKVGREMVQERNTLAEALDMDSEDLQNRINKFYQRWYGTPEKRRLHQEKYYKGVNDAPPSLKHRYLTEDVIYGLVPMSYLADLGEVETPTIDAIIHLSSLVNETNYWEEGMTLKNLGLEGMSIEEMLRFVNTGSA